MNYYDKMLELPEALAVILGAPRNAVAKMPETSWRLAEFKMRAERGDFNVQSDNEDLLVSPPCRRPMTDEEFDTAKALVLKYPSDTPAMFHEMQLLAYLLNASVLAAANELDMRDALVRAAGQYGFNLGLNDDIVKKLSKAVKRFSDDVRSALSGTFMTSADMSEEESALLKGIGLLRHDEVQ